MVEELQAGTAVLCPVPVMETVDEYRVKKAAEHLHRNVVLPRLDARGNAITRDAAGQYLVKIGEATWHARVVVAFDSELVVV